MFARLGVLDLYPNVKDGAPPLDILIDSIINTYISNT